MAKSARVTTKPTAAELASTQPTPAIKVLAGIGAVVLVFITIVLARWVTGPFFERVPAGPSDPPGWMKANLIFWQVVSPAAALSLIYWFVVRPWRRDRTIPLDGLLILAFCTLWFQDPLCNFTGSWVTYNTWMFNMGSWHSSVPGSASFAAPGQMLAEPLLLIPFLYVYFFWLASVMGCWVMRKVARRRPSAGKPTLIFSCFAVILFFDFVLEGLVWMPGGAWTLAGGHVPVLFEGKYHQFTINEWFPVSATLTAVACIRYFRNDRGQTVAERGIDQLRVSSRRQLLLRFLAITGLVHVAMFSFYVAPNFIFGLHSTEWPRDVQERSYFTNFICGDGTDRACPGPDVPNVRPDNGEGGPRSMFTDRNGVLQLSPESRRPAPVDFKP